MRVVGAFRLLRNQREQPPPRWRFRRWLDTAAVPRLPVKRLLDGEYIILLCSGCWTGFVEWTWLRHIAVVVYRNAGTRCGAGPLFPARLLLLL